MTPLSQLAWTQFWQVTAVAAGVGVIVTVCCRQRPHLAHIMWLVVLVKCVTPPLWSSPTSLFSWATRDSSAAMPSVSAPVDATIGQTPMPEPSPATQHGISGSGEVPSSASFRDAGTASSDTSSELPAKPNAWLTNVRFALVLGVSWLIGAAAYAGYAFLAAIHYWRTMRTSRIPTDGRLTRLAVDLSRRLGIRRAVRVWVTREPLGPLTFGWVRPTVVLPEALAAHRSTDELEPLLAHELVHVRRGDALVGLIQTLVQCLWWFHPLIWWVNRRIVFERERCCDEEVVAGLAFEPARYARGLLSVLELKRQLRWLAASPGARPFEITQQRLEHIMLRGGRFRAKTPHGYWLTLIVLALLLVPGAGLNGSSSSVASSPREPQFNRLAEPKLQTDNAKPKKLDRAEQAVDKANPAEAEMHVIGVYGPKNRDGKDPGIVDVEIRPTATPVVLVLTSYFSVDWHIKLAVGARIKKAIVSGYFAQEIKGLPADVPVESRSYFPDDGSRRKEGWFYAYKSNTLEYRRMVELLNDMTGLLVSTFQGENSGTSFVIDGTRGRNFAQKERKPRPTLPKEVKPEEFLAASADADLHVVSIYWTGPDNNGSPVEVEVRPSTKPVVLALASYMSVLWNVKNRPRRSGQGGHCRRLLRTRDRGHSCHHSCRVPGLLSGPE